MYIEIIKVFEILGIIADIKLIHATYRALSVAVKSEPRQMRLSLNKKGKSVFQIHPIWVWLQTDIQNGFWENFGQIMVAFLGHVALSKKGYHRFLGASKSFD